MQKIVLSLIFCFVLMFGKQYSTAQTHHPITKKTATYQYQVICSSGTWSGSYLADDGGSVDLHHAVSGWTYTGKPKYYPAFQPNLVITPDIDSAGIIFTINLYVNGKQVRNNVFTTTGDYGSDHGSVNYNIQ